MVRNLLKKLLPFTLFLSLSAFGACPDLRGQYSLLDGKTECKIKRKGDVLFVQGDMPIISLMSKPGPRYGYLLQRIGIGVMNEIELSQDNCTSINLNSLLNNQKSLLIEAGKFDYFGAKSPIVVETKINEKDLSQDMLITKYTTIANGVKTVYKNLKYSSSISLNDKNDLVVKSGVVYEKRNKKFEKIECIFKRN